MKIKIEGMMCEHCAAHVAEALNNIPGLSDVKVNLADKSATCSGTAETAAITAAIEEEGYTVTGIEA